MRVHFLGTGDAFCSGGRNQSCLHVRAAGLEFLVDCGATSLAAMRRAGVDPNGIDLVLLTHLHGDHFGGLPFLLLDALFASARTRPLTIMGPPGTRARLDQATEVLFPGTAGLDRPYALEVREMPLAEASRHGPVAVTPHEVVHPSGAPSTALRIEAGGKVLGVSGDTEWTEALLPVARDADLFVCECYAADGPVPSHLDSATLLARRGQLTARRMLVTHMGPEMLAAPPHPLLERAEDGMVVEL